MEDFFTKVLNYSIKKCEKLLPLLIDFDLKHCIKTQHLKTRLQQGVLIFPRSCRSKGRFVTYSTSYSSSSSDSKLRDYWLKPWIEYLVELSAEIGTYRLFQVQTEGRPKG
jgi:hypothetical protein